MFKNVRKTKYKIYRVSFRNFSFYVIGIDRGRLERKREKAIASYGDSVLRRVCHDSTYYLFLDVNRLATRVVRLENPSCTSSTMVIRFHFFFFFFFSSQRRIGRLINAPLLTIESRFYSFRRFKFLSNSLGWRSFGLFKFELIFVDPQPTSSFLFLWNYVVKKYDS